MPTSSKIPCAKTFSCPVALEEDGRRIFIQTGTWLVCRELAEAAGPWDTRLTMMTTGNIFAACSWPPKAPVSYRNPVFLEELRGKA